MRNQQILAGALAATMLAVVTAANGGEVPVTETGVRSKYEFDRPSRVIQPIRVDEETGIRSKYDYDRPSVVIREVRRRFADVRLGPMGLLPVPEYLQQDKPEKYQYDHPAEVVRRFYGMESPPAESLDDPGISIHEETAMIDVIRLQGRVVRADKPITRASLSSEKIARAMRLSENEISVVGLVHGSTSLTVWLEGEPAPRHFVVRVGRAAGARAWIIGSLGKLEGIDGTDR